MGDANTMGMQTPGQPHIKIKSSFTETTLVLRPTE
jgi:hypothetical protein